MRNVLALLTLPAVLLAQGGRGRANAPQTVYYLTPQAVWAGSSSAPHSDGAVIVRSDTTAAVGRKSRVTAPAGATMVDLPGTTLIPGMIEGHSHLLLHPYNET